MRFQSCYLVFIDNNIKELFPLIHIVQRLVDLVDIVGKIILSYPALMHESVSIFVEFLKSNLFLSSVFCIQTRIISPIVYYALKACFVIQTTRF